MKFRKFMLRTFINHFLKYPVPNIVPRTGEAAEKINGFIIEIYKKDGDKFLVQKLNDSTIETLQLNRETKAFELPKILRLKDIEPQDIQVTHFYGLSTIYYSGLNDLIFDYLTKFAYLKLWYKIIEDYIYQQSFNIRGFRKQNRIEILSFIVNKKLSENVNRQNSWMFSNRDEFSPSDLLTDMYSIRWYRSQLGDNEKGKIVLYLDSLASSGDLEKTKNGNYILSGKAIESLEKYKEDERRHSQMAWLQFLIVLLTLVIALTGIVQNFKAFQCFYFWIGNLIFYFINLVF